MPADLRVDAFADILGCSDSHWEQSGRDDIPARSGGAPSRSVLERDLNARAFGALQVSDDVEWFLAWGLPVDRSMRMRLLAGICVTLPRRLNPRGPLT